MATLVGLREKTPCTNCKNGRNGILICSKCCSTGTVLEGVSVEGRNAIIDEALRAQVFLRSRRSGGLLVEK